MQNAKLLNDGLFRKTYAIKLLFKNHFAYANSQVDGSLHVTYFNSHLHISSQISFISIYK